MLIELRRYAVRAGAMDEMHERMRDMLLPLFREHGVPTPFAMWENRAETSILTWMLEWPSFEARQETWTRFYPVFVAARHAEGGEEFVLRTDLTLIAPWPGRAFAFAGGEGACETAWRVQPRVMFGAAFRAACLDDDFRVLRDAGATAVAACDFIFGPLPQSLLLVSWPDAVTRREGIAEIGRQPIAPNLATAILGEGLSPLDLGRWEALDRASYLKNWRTDKSVG
jgi:hypothetical protein